MGLDELRLRAERFGVERGFWAAGEWVEPSEETLRGVLAAMRVGDDEWTNLVASLCISLRFLSFY